MIFTMLPTVMQGGGSFTPGAPTIGYDSDAAAWFALQLATGFPITTANKAVINAFIVGCKSDPSPMPGVSNWAACQILTLLCGAETLTGALIPFKGTAPTNHNFVSGDYSKLTGLKGSTVNGPTLGKRLGMNRNCEDDPVDNAHVYFYVTEANSVANDHVMFGGGNVHGQNYFRFMGPNYSIRMRSTGVTTVTPIPLAGGFGGSVSSATLALNLLADRVSESARSSFTSTATQTLFAAPSGYQVCDTRIAIYTLGESVNLYTLNRRFKSLLATLT